MKPKLLTLTQAQQQAKLDQFAKEHPSTGDKDKLDQLLKAMVKPSSSS